MNVEDSTFIPNLEQMKSKLEKEKEQLQQLNYSDEPQKEKKLGLF